MSYLIDTNVVSEVRKGGRCHPHVSAWWHGVAADDLFLSALSVGEIRKGIEQVRPRRPQMAADLERWLEQTVAGFAGRILAVTTDIAEEWGRMSAVRTVAAPDALLAATAIVHGLTLVTRNEADVADLGADILNPFKA